MNTVEKYRIRNEHVRNKLGVPHILDIVKKGNMTSWEK
jgi:hypothetical protein